VSGCTALETVLFEKRRGIACITLNRPHVLNAYSVQMRDDLYVVLTAIRDDDEKFVQLFLKVPAGHSAPALTSRSS
jgi:enoyl-CoA hydratase/carnithine racemase